MVVRYRMRMATILPDKMIDDQPNYVNEFKKNKVLYMIRYYHTDANNVDKT